MNPSNDIDGFRIIDSGDCCGEECECAPVTRDLDAIIHPPLVHGGQGRTDDEMGRAAYALMFVICGSIAVGTIVGLWLLILKVSGV
jgi:hypothetical protein